jgi:Tol biopolymer transport system component
VIDQHSVERAAERFRLPEGSFERLMLRRDRKDRDRRIRAGAVGIIVALATGIVLGRSLTPDAIPADQPVEPQPAPSGALVYALDGNIYVADPDGSNAVKIADAAADTGCEGTSEYSAPSWSPDGRYLAFQHLCTSSEPSYGDVVISDPHGNVVAEFPKEGWGFTWSPDSTRVAAWETWGATIGVYSVDGERQASLPMPTVKGGDDSAPGWMPDGSALLVYGYVVVPLDGSSAHELSLGGHAASYSPDGTLVAVLEHDSITVLDADGSPVSQVDEIDGVDAWADAWAPDGDRFALVFQSQSGDAISAYDGELIVVDAGSGTVTVLPEATAALNGGEIQEVRGFSPGGDRILYQTGDGAGGNTALWSIGVDGSDPRLIVAGTPQGDWRPR